MNFKLMVSNFGFWCRKNSPALLVAGGIISAAASVGLAVYSTTKLDKVLSPYNKKIDEIKSDLKNDNKIQNKEIDEKELKKELSKTYGKAVLKVGALYLPSILFFATSTSCILGSHKIMKGRNLALAATCTTLENSYRAYRKRVQEKLGEEAEEKLYKDIRKEKVEVLDPKTGKIKEKTLDTPHVGSNENWNVLFDCGNPGWERDAQLTFDYLMKQQCYLNDKLQRQGYLFLSDVYDLLGYSTDMLGEEKSRAAHILGWIYNPIDKTRNSFISFGLTQAGTTIPLPRIAEQLMRNEPSFWLDMNVDGDILSGEYGKEVFTKYAKGLG